jgi:hypothetical protein
MARAVHRDECTCRREPIKSRFFSFDAILLLPASTHAQRPRELAFQGIAADGIFDPSIVGTRRGEWAWMAHSVVDPSAKLGIWKCPGTSFFHGEFNAILAFLSTHVHYLPHKTTVKIGSEIGSGAVLVQEKRLSARVVATLARPGRHADGGGLYSPYPIATTSPDGCTCSPGKASSRPWAWGHIP